MAVLKRRRRSHTNEMPIGITVSRSRHFTVDLGELPMDHEDAARVTAAIEELDPKPSEVEGPVPSGAGDLVYDGWVVTYTDDPREDWEIMLDVEDAVRAGLWNRAWLVDGHNVRGSDRSRQDWNARR
jgi:hypothetical protein